MRCQWGNGGNRGSKVEKMERKKSTTTNHKNTEKNKISLQFSELGHIDSYDVHKFPILRGSPQLSLDSISLRSLDQAHKWV